MWDLVLMLAPGICPLQVSVCYICNLKPMACRLSLVCQARSILKKFFSSGQLLACPIKTKITKVCALAHDHNRNNLGSFRKTQLYPSLQPNVP